MLNFQREVDRLFNQFWPDLPARTASGSWGPSFRVHTTDDAWHVKIPIPGIDPKDVSIEVAGNTFTIRAERPADYEGGQPTRYEQSISVPQLLDINKVAASHRFGMLVLTLPVKESVKPRRIEIASSTVSIPTSPTPVATAGTTRASAAQGTSGSARNTSRTRLPQTASSMPMWMLAGALALSAGIGLMCWRRPRL